MGCGPVGAALIGGSPLLRHPLLLCYTAATMKTTSKTDPILSPKTRAAVEQGLAQSRAGLARPRTERRTHVETGKTVKVLLAYHSVCCFGKPYEITRITNEIAVPVGHESKHVGDRLTEKEATDLLTEPGLEVTTVPAKES